MKCIVLITTNNRIYTNYDSVMHEKKTTLLGSYNQFIKYEYSKLNEIGKKMHIVYIMAPLERIDDNTYAFEIALRYIEEKHKIVPIANSQTLYWDIVNMKNIDISCALDIINGKSTEDLTTDYQGYNPFALKVARWHLLTMTAWTYIYNSESKNNRWDRIKAKEETYMSDELERCNEIKSAQGIYYRDTRLDALSVYSDNLFVFSSMSNAEYIMNRRRYKYIHLENIHNNKKEWKYELFWEIYTKSDNKVVPAFSDYFETILLVDKTYDDYDLLGYLRQLGLHPRYINGIEEYGGDSYR